MVGAEHEGARVLTGWRTTCELWWGNQSQLMGAAMKERPILFSSEMVRAILDGRKTQTRRVVNPQSLLDNKTRVTACYECPYGAPGDSLWVRESCQIYGHWVKNGHTKSGAQRWKFSIHASKRVLYAGGFVKSPSDKTQLGFYKRPSIFMPRWASRIALAVTDVRVERLQEISEEDAIAEGLQKEVISVGYQNDSVTLRARPKFVYLWDKINSDRGYSFESNPWVWVISFKVV